MFAGASLSRAAHLGSTSSHDQMLVTSITAVPEPATWAMLILGVAMIGFVARRRADAIAVAA